MKLNKKANMQEIGGLAVGIAAFSLMIIISFLIMANTKTQGVTLISSVQYLNETVAFANNSYIALTQDQGVYLRCDIVKSTQLGVISAANYTCLTGKGIKFIDINSSKYGADVAAGNYTTVVSYTIKPTDYAYNSTNTLQNATQTVPGWVPLIVLIAIGGILLMMVRSFQQ